MTDYRVSVTEVKSGGSGCGTLIFWCIVIAIAFAMCAK